MAQETHGLEALWACGSERSAGLLHIWEVHNRVCILEPPSSQIPAVLQTWPSGPLLIHLSAPPAPPPYKGHFFCDFKILGSYSSECPLPYSHHWTLNSLILQWDSDILSPSPKVIFSLSSTSTLFSAQEDSMPSLGPCPPAHVSSGYAYTKISSLYLIWSHPMGPPGGYYLFFHTLI